MINTLLGQKIEMTQMFVDGSRLPVTNLHLGPCIVTQIKTQEKDGYTAVQIGFGWKKIKNVTKPLQGHLKGAIQKKKAPLTLAEVKVSDPSKHKVGDLVKLSDVFHVGDTVTVTGTTKGKGFTGVVKRWGFAGAPASHGHGGQLRKPGSIGQGTDPGRVFKGKKMAGRVGASKRQIPGLKVLAIDGENDTVSIGGPVPGPNKSYVLVKKTKNAPTKKKVKDEN
ncbi:50S ribosomal protein L3 [Patescibacteria group bacterium]